MYNELCKTPSDINEHLSTLKELASECQHVTELGVRYIVSSWAFLEGLKYGDTLVSVDIRHPYEYGGNLDEFELACKKRGVEFKFVLGDTRLIDIDETDLLFIDTEHTYVVLKNELNRHSDKARKYIVFHDTVSEKDALMPVINELIVEGKWKLHKHYENNNGLLILKRC